MKPQAIIFDFDGVLADTEPLHLRAYQTILGAQGIHLSREEYYAKYLGFDDAGLFQALADDRDLDVTNTQMEQWIAEKTKVITDLLQSDSVLFPGAVSCVRTLAPLAPMGIASGALEPEIAIVLNASGLSGSFKVIASASDGVRGKPAPDLYLLALAKLRRFTPIQPDGAVAIEDSVWGLEAARAAGLKTIGITHTYPAAELKGADLVVTDLAAITPEALHSL